MSALQGYARCLESAYGRLNHRERVKPDPLQFLYAYADPADQELVALLAACLAYGRVAHILKSVRAVLERLGDRPARFCRDAGRAGLSKTLAGLKHRFADARQIACLLSAAATVAGEHGSMGECFAASLRAGDRTVLPALRAFTARLWDAGAPRTHLLADPSGTSACKRLHLYLRWMVRRDDVDPGGWDGVEPAMLIVPLDVHMHRICRGLGATRRRSADLTAAMEATEAFRAIRPEDPVRYDFTLTRMGIWGQTGSRANGGSRTRDRRGLGNAADLVTEVTRPADCA